MALTLWARERARECVGDVGMPVVSVPPKMSGTAPMLDSLAPGMESSLLNCWELS